MKRFTKSRRRTGKKSRNRSMKSKARKIVRALRIGFRL